MVALGNNSALLERFSQGIREDEIDPGANHLYSVAALTDAAGSVVERYRYDTYGNRTVLAADGVTTRTTSSYNQQVGFTGRYLDKETGLWFFRARYYSGSLGRFVSRDDVATPLARAPDEYYEDGYDLYGAYFAPNDLDPLGQSISGWLNDTISEAIKNTRKQGRYQRENKFEWKITDKWKGGAKYGIIGEVLWDNGKDCWCAKMSGYGAAYVQTEWPLPPPIGWFGSMVVEVSAALSGNITCCGKKSDNPNWQYEVGGGYCNGDITIPFGIKVAARVGYNGEKFKAYVEGGGFLGGTYSFRTGHLKVAGYIFVGFTYEVRAGSGWWGSKFSYSHKGEARFGTSVDM